MLSITSNESRTRYDVQTVKRGYVVKFRISAAVVKSKALNDDFPLDIFT